MTFLLTSTLRTSVLLALALGVTALLRNRPAAWRHWVWSITVACAAAVPFLTLTVPSWQVPLRAVLPIERGEFRAEPIKTLDAARPAISGIRQQPSAQHEVATVARVAAVVWPVGAACSLLVLVAGLGRLAWISARSRRIASDTWVQLSAQLSREHGLSRPVPLLETDHPTLLVTWGVVRPVVIVPAAARAWPLERVRVVLAHEIAHVARHDWLVQIAAELLRCAYWFNPLVWIACRRIRLEAEHAADDAVLNSGVMAVDYADQLVDLARTFGGRRRGWLPAPAIARPSSLERRVRAMLNTKIERSPMSPALRVMIALALFGAAVTIAAAQGPFATFSGSIIDPMNGTLSNATLRLTNTQNNSKYEVRSNTAGQFEFVGLPPGEYVLEAFFVGFETLRGTLSVTGQNVQRDLTLKIGSLEETLTIRAGGAPPARTSAPRRTSSSSSAGCTAGPTGGTIRPPTKLDDEHPLYPQHIADAKIGGVVVLEGAIGTDGTMKDVHVVRAAHPELDAAAVDAMRQWRFTETLLNCVPVEVFMKATMRFSPE